VEAGPGGEPVPDIWEIDVTQLDAARNYGDFLVLAPGSTARQAPITVAGAIREFGQPARVYHVQQYTILVWDENILSLLTVPAGLGLPDGP